MPRIAFLGPSGTFTEEALLTQGDLADGELVPVGSIPEVLAVTQRGDTDLGFVAIENAIEGTVNASIDALAFDHDLLIQREVVLPIHQNLLALPGTALADVRAVMSIPVATAQVRAWLGTHLPGVEEIAANSTAEAARLVGRGDRPGTAAIAPAVAAKVYGLDVLAAEIEDHPENKTRFVVVAREGVPAPTGNDKSTIVCFQSFDRPGSLLAILQEFAARAINLTKLESRPTKTSLGDYCFAIDFEGHLADEVVADCLRDVRLKSADVKFLGSYPAAGEKGEARRRDAEAAWKQADAWVRRLREGIDRR